LFSRNFYLRFGAFCSKILATFSVKTKTITKRHALLKNWKMKMKQPDQKNNDDDASPEVSEVDSEDSIEGTEDTKDKAEDNPKPGTSVQNPFFNKSKRAKIEENSDSDSSFDSGSDGDVEDEDENEDGEDDIKDDKGQEEEEEDPLITALKKSKEKPERKCPPDISSKNFVTDISFHPKNPLLAHSTITGKPSVLALKVFI
jgi:hypothetical protein